MAGLTGIVGDRPGRARRGLPIRAKIVALTVGIAFLTAATVGGVNVLQIRELTHREEMQRLQNEAGLIAAHVPAPFDTMRNDVLTIVRTPPFAGIARATAHHGTDPQDGSTLSDWQRRLETIFASALANTPAYVQFRFIGVADGGRELVRVDRTPDGVRVASRGELRAKADQPYFPEGLATPRGEVRLSALTLNPDRGNVDFEMPVIRAMSPVYGPDGALFGLFVVNAKYDVLLDGIFRRISPSGDLFILNEAGDYIVKLRRREFGQLRLAAENEETPPAAVAQLRRRNGRSGTGAYVDASGRNHLSAVQVDLGDMRPGHAITVAVSAPEARLARVADEATASAVTAGASIVAAVTLIAFFVASALTRPLKELAGELGARDGARVRHEGLAARPDEIGDAYRAYEKLSGDLVEANTATRTAIERMRTLRYKAADALIVIDEAGVIAEFNESAQQMFGYAEYEAVGRNVSMLMPSPHREAHDSYLARYAETGEKRIIGGIRNVEALRRNGEMFPAELRVGEFEIDGRRYFNGIVRDVTERVSLQRRVAAQMDELARTNADLDAFAHLASNDLAGSLRSIEREIGALEVQLGEELGEEGRRRLAGLHDTSAKSANLTARLVEWLRAGEARLVRERLDPVAVVAGTTVAVAATPEATGTEILCEPGMPDIHGDRAQVSALFSALIANGLSYNDSDRKTVRVGYRADAPGPTGAPVGAFHVADNGIGIPPEQRAAAFRLFTRLPGSDAYGPGAGTGLSLAQRIVERHGGRIWIADGPGPGTTVRFTLPLAGGLSA